MNKKMVLGSVCVGLAAILLFPADLLAITTDTFQVQEIDKHATKISNFLFGAPMKIAGIAGGAYGLFQSIMGSSVKPLLAYGGIGLAVNLVPKFVDAVFPVSSMLVP